MLDPTVKFSNDLLVEFETVVDVDLSILTLIQKKYNNPTYMKKEVLEADEVQLKRLILNTRFENPLEIAMKEEYQENIPSIYKSMIAEDIDEIYKSSKPTNVFGLVETYKKTNGVINSTILCKDERQQNFIKSIDSTLNTKIDKYTSLENYDSIFIKRYKDILKYKKVEGKHIFIMHYNFNIELNKPGLPIIQVSAQIMDVNKIYLIDPYLNLKPEGRTEE